MRVSSAPRPAAERRGTPPCDALRLSGASRRAGRLWLGRSGRAGTRGPEIRLEGSACRIETGRSSKGKPVPTRPPDWRKTPSGDFHFQSALRPSSVRPSRVRVSPARRGRDSLSDKGRRPAETLQGGLLILAPISTAGDPDRSGRRRRTVPAGYTLANGHGPRGVPRGIEAALNVGGDWMVREMPPPPAAKRES